MDINLPTGIGLTFTALYYIITVTLIIIFIMAKGIVKKETRQKISIWMMIGITPIPMDYILFTFADTNRHFMDDMMGGTLGILFAPLLYVLFFKGVAKVVVKFILVIVGEFIHGALNSPPETAEEIAENEEWHREYRRQAEEREEEERWAVDPLNPLWDQVD